MIKTDLKDINLPDVPGVYFFLGDKKQVLYIGKATSLKQRVKSYFVPNIREVRSALIENMVVEAATIDFTTTDSVLEALILETNLIRSHKPKFNSRSKDDKSYNHLVITKEEWPRVLLVRGKDLTEKFAEEEIQCHFGPLPSGGLLRDALKIVRRLFRFYDTKLPIGTEKSKVVKGRIDFNRQIGLYPELGDKEAYQKTIRHLKLFFQGKKLVIVNELEREMQRLAKNEEFEAAELVKRKIFALKHIEDIALIKRELNDSPDKSAFRIEAYDVAHLAGQSMVGVMTVVSGQEPQKSEYRKFKINSVKQANDPAALREILSRRLTHTEWPLPKLIVVDGNEVQKRVAEEVLSEVNLSIPVAAVTKNAQHKPERVIALASILKTHQLEILLANAEAHRFAITYFRHKSRRAALN